jgi:transposase-like protein
MVIVLRQHNATFKAKVAFEAAEGEKTLAQIASEFDIHPNRVRQRRQHLLELLPAFFPTAASVWKRTGENEYKKCPGQIDSIS